MSARKSLPFRILLCALLLGSAARSEPTPADRAAAEALFEQALALMEKGQPEQACPKFEESQKLDPGVGTLLYLADCYEAAGRTASAWATFLQASYAAKNAGQDDRQQIAETNAERIKPSLSKLVLVVRDKTIPGLSIKTDDQQLNVATWGTEMPVDPGEHLLTAEAEGRQTWSTTITVPNGPGVTTVEIPQLPEVAPAIVAPVVEQTVPPPSSPPVSAAASGRETRRDMSGSGQATWGWVSIIGGGAALAGSGLFTFLAVSDNSRADEQCRQDDPRLCGEPGVELGNDAATKANIATALAGIGGALTITGAVLVLTAPDGSEQARVRMGTAVASQPLLVVEGTF